MYRYKKGAFGPFFIGSFEILAVIRRRELVNELKNKLNIHQHELEQQFFKVGEGCLSLISNAGLETKDFTSGTIPKFFNDIEQKGFNFTFLSRSETIEKAIENHKYYKILR